MPKTQKNFLNRLVDRFYPTDEHVIAEFHKLFFGRHFVYNKPMEIFWQGVPVQKNPLDLWIYQEIIAESKPDIIIECGSGEGGTSLFLAHMCEIINNGMIITIDIENKHGQLHHNRIKFLLGSSTADQTVKQVKELIRKDDKVLVILDSEHNKDHVLKEMNIYSKLVTSESYLIVEDTNINGHPVYSFHGPGPMEAVKKFLKNNQDFIVDYRKEKFLFTFNPRGYLKKIKKGTQPKD